MTQNLDWKHFYPRVYQAIATDDYKIYSYFNDGSVRMFDVKPLIKPGTVFEPLQDIEFFKSKLTVIGYTAAWDAEGKRDPTKCIDLDPLVLFAQPMVADPLEKESTGPIE